MYPPYASDILEFAETPWAAASGTQACRLQSKPCADLGQILWKANSLQLTC